jgi:hypothetical protein
MVDFRDPDCENGRWIELLHDCFQWWPLALVVVNQSISSVYYLLIIYVYKMVYNCLRMNVMLFHAVCMYLCKRHRV